MIIIGITGTQGAGKGEVSAYLQKKGFMHFSVRDFLTLELKRRGSEIRRDIMTPLADELRKTHGPSYIIEELYAMVLDKGKDAIIESIRAKAEADFMKSKGAILMSVDADSKIRYERIRQRKSALDNVTYEQFLWDESREIASVEANRGNISDCMRRSDFHFTNNGTVKELHAQIDIALAVIKIK